MNYTITGKNGVTPQSLRGIKSLKEVMAAIDSFMAFNAPKKAVQDATAKINYYNKNSFYTVKEV